MSDLDENSRPDLTLTREPEFVGSLFDQFRAAIISELQHLDGVNWDLKKFFEPYCRSVLQKLPDYAKAFVGFISEPSEQGAKQFLSAHGDLEEAVNKTPFLFELYYISELVRRQLGNNCAEDIAAAMNKFKIPKHGDGTVNTNQVISLLNRFAALHEPINQTKECSEREAIMFRYSLGCKHILDASSTKEPHKNDILSKKRQGGNFVHILSRFAQKKETVAFFRRLESFRRNRTPALTDDELTTASVQFLEIKATYLASLSERKWFTQALGLQFNICEEIDILNKRIGEELINGHILDGRPLKNYAIRFKN